MGAAAKLGGTAGAGIRAQGLHGGTTPWDLLRRGWAGLAAFYIQAMRAEIAARRPFLWIPVAAGAGAILHLTADREPSLAAAFVFFLTASLIAWLTRARPLVFAASVAVAALCFGLAMATLRTALVAAPVLERLRIAKVTGWVEELNPRREGARFVLRVASIEGFTPETTPYRIRLTTRSDPRISAGQFVSLTARLLPPARASLPGGYDFARDAYFVRLGAVGNALGAIRPAEEPRIAPLSLRVFARLDHVRNALAARISTILPGGSGAVAVAMVTGKRDLLDDATKDVIREAGIFHIITISGVQMTLVAGILFWIFRTGLALSRTLALHHPIKIWAACGAMVGAVLYDIGTGSRVGTERALWMTLILLGAVIVGRRAFSMRNLALAALLVVIFEPEALLGASFQLSFAAVAALISVWEARNAARLRPGAKAEAGLQLKPDRNDRLLRLIDRLRTAPAHALFSTLCATSATASFMANDFHELSPYVLIGNPLTLIIIEMFAVPGALIGTVLYPLGLDAWVWLYVGMGIDFVLWAASWIAAAPAATVHLPAFAPWTLPFLSLAVLSAVLWRSWPMRLTALPLLAIGLVGTGMGPRYDLVVAPTGDALAMRDDAGQLEVVGRRPSLFAIEQWLRADADGRPARAALVAGKAGQGDLVRRCDALGCAISGADALVSVVLDQRAFAEDCARADIIVSPLMAPVGCAAMLVLDRSRLANTGAAGLQFVDGQIRLVPARSADEDRPWSPAPRSFFRRKTATAPDTDWRELDAEDGREERPFK
jgi:competence protein ComEC